MDTISVNVRLRKMSVYIPGLFIAASNANQHEKEAAGASFTCTGSNDQILIQTVIDSLGSSGGKVNLSSGVFYISAPLVVGDNITIEGQGTSTILRLTANCNLFVSKNFGSSTIYHPKFRDMQWDGNYKVGSGFKGSCTYGDFEGLWVWKFGEHGILVNCEVSPYALENNILHCRIRDNSMNGIYFKGSVKENRILDGCTIYNNGLAGVKLESTSSHICQHVYIQNGNFIEANKYNIEIIDGQDYHIHGNELTMAKNHSIYVHKNLTTWSGFINVMMNNFYRNGTTPNQYDAINANGVSLTARLNTFSGAGYDRYNVYLGSNTSGCIIADNSLGGAVSGAVYNGGSNNIVQAT